MKPRDTTVELEDAHDETRRALEQVELLEARVAMLHTQLDAARRESEHLLSRVADLKAMNEYAWSQAAKS